MFHFWLFVSGIVGLTAVVAGALGAHGLDDILAANPYHAKIYGSALQFHLVHAIALFSVIVLCAATEGRRNAWGTVMLNLAALAFLLGIMLFSGGIYYQVVNLAQSGLMIVPAGGVSFMVGWIAVALSAFGYRKVCS